ncbi:RluA family pseudouridine synthase [soil metagenome]
MLAGNDVGSAQSDDPAYNELMDFKLDSFTVIAPEEGHTLAKVLRSRLHASLPSWNQVRTLIEGRRVQVGGGVCIDPTRRLREGDRVELLKSPARIPMLNSDLVLRQLEDHFVVVEKPAGVSSVRHPAELDWPEEKRRLDPTLQDLTQWQIAKQLNRNAKTLPPLRIVHRLDRDTSGLLLFARTVLAEREIGRQFRKHTVVRRYLALVPGIFLPQTIRTTLIRDRGDGRRGSTKQPDVTGKEAITHVTVEEALPGFTLLSCKLETGKTHQIRIHLSEAGHPVCGEKVYTKTTGGVELPKAMHAPRLCLHAAELGFEHPVTNAHVHWAMPLPRDIQTFVDTIRKSHFKRS